MRVLVGTDGSVSAHAALRWAIGFVGAEGGEIVVIAVRDPSMFEVHPEDIERRRAEWFDRLEEWAAPVADAAIPHRTALFEGDPRAQLLEAAASEKADLVVVGTRGSGGRRHAVHLGSTSHHLVHHSTVPLIVVPETAATSWPTTIVIGVDGSVGSARAVAWLAAYGKALTDDVVAVHAEKPLAQWRPTDDPESWYQTALRDMQAWVVPLREFGLGARTRVVDGDPVDALTDVAIGEGAGLVVVGARGKGGVSGMRLGSTALKLLNQAQLPVLMVPADVR